MAELSMQDILSDKKPEVVQVETKEPVTEEKVEKVQSVRQAHRDREQLAKGLVRDPDTGQFSPKIEPEVKEVKAEPAAIPAKPVAAAPSQELTDKEKAFLKGMQEERTKRQELERRMAAIEASKPKEPEKTFWDDPEAAQKKQLEEIEKIRREMRQEADKARLGTSEYHARQRYQDFDAKIAKFTDLCEKTPGLWQQCIATADPADFAYNTAKQHVELQEAGSIEGLKAKIEKELRLKIEGELKEKAEALEKERAALPPSLSDARSKGNNKTVWSGPPSMDSILKG